MTGEGSGDEPCETGPVCNVLCAQHRFRPSVSRPHRHQFRQLFYQGLCLCLLSHVLTPFPQLFCLADWLSWIRVVECFVIVCLEEPRSQASLLGIIPTLLCRTPLLAIAYTLMCILLSSNAFGSLW